MGEPLRIAIRRLLLCWWGGCGGYIARDASDKICFKCATCGRITK